MNTEEINFRELVDEVAELIQSVAADGSFLYTNKAWRETLGYGADEISRLKMVDIVHPESRDYCAAMFERVKRGEKPYKIEAKFITKDRRIIKVEGSSFRSLENGKLISTHTIFRDITERGKVEQELRESQELFNAFMNNSPAAAFMKDAAGRFVFANKTLVEMFHLANYRENTITAHDITDNKSAGKADEKFRKVLDSWETLETIDTAVTPDGVLRQLLVIRFPFAKTDGQKFVGGVAIDITKSKKAEEKLRHSEQHFRHLMENSQGLICTHNLDGKLLSVNPAVRTLLGYRTGEMVGKNLSEFLVPAKRAEFDGYLERIRQNSVDSGLMVVRAKDGTDKIWKYNNVKLSEAAEKAFVLGHAQDVTEMHETQKRLKNLSLTDDLTGLYNRRGFSMLAERQIKVVRSRPKNESINLIFADMDGLKQINDTFGHDKGSEAIARLSEILASNFRASDIIARLGGDEFVVLVVDQNNAGSKIIINRLQTKISDYNKKSGSPFKLSLSVGITPVDLNENITLEELLVRADQAMYEQKRQKKSKKF